MSAYGQETVRQLDRKVNEILNAERGWRGGVTLDPASLVAIFNHFRTRVQHLDDAFDELHRAKERQATND